MWVRVYVNVNVGLLTDHWQFTLSNPRQVRSPSRITIGACFLDFGGDEVLESFFGIHYFMLIPRSVHPDHGEAGGKSGCGFKDDVQQATL